MKAFFDGTGQLWQSGALAGKLCATFTSTGTANGGQESTHMTTLTNMVHHGMIYVPLGYQAGAEGHSTAEGSVAVRSHKQTTVRSFTAKGETCLNG